MLSGGRPSVHVPSWALPWLSERLGRMHTVAVPLTWVEGMRRCPKQEVMEGCLVDLVGSSRSEGAWRIQGGLCMRTLVAAPWVAWPAQPAVFCGVKRKLRGGGSCSGPGPRLTPHMAKVHRRLAIKERTSLRGKMTQGLLLCKQTQKKHQFLLGLSLLSLKSCKCTH